MSVSGRLWAQLAWVALRDADAVLAGGVGGKKRDSNPPPSEAELREAERLRVLGMRFSYRARAEGFCSQGTDYAFGDEPQTFVSCWCGRLFGVGDWRALELVGVERRGYRAREIRLCECGRTLGADSPRGV